MALSHLLRCELLCLLVSELLTIGRDEFMFTHIIFIIAAYNTRKGFVQEWKDFIKLEQSWKRDINIMIILEFKDEPQPYILPQKSKSLNVRSCKSKPLTFENSKLASAFRKKSSPERHYQQIILKKKSLYNKAVLPVQNKLSVTSVPNSNIDFQLFNIAPPNDDSKNRFLKKKSLSILKAPEKQNTYRSLSMLKRSHTVDNQIKLSRTEIMKSMLLQYDKSAEQLARAKKGKQQSRNQKSPFLTDYGYNSAKSKGSNKLNNPNKFNRQGQKSLRMIIKEQQSPNLSLNEEQIQIIVRNSLREIELQRKSKGKSPTKSLISFTQRTTYIKRMKRVQNGLQYI